MKRPHLLLLLAVFLVPVMTPQAATQTADEVIEKHLAALGGRDVLAKITTRKATGMITVSTPQGEFSGPFESYSKAPNKSRGVMVLDLSSAGVNEKMTLDQKFDGTTGWALNSLQGDTQITGNQLDNMRNSFFPSALLNYKTTGTTAELLPNETVGGKSTIVLKLTPKTGSAMKVFLDPDTYLPVRTSATVNSPQMGGDIEQIGEASDYRKVNGVMVPFKTVQIAGPQRVTIVLTTVEHNVPIDDTMFVK
jgi:outer membrane lipoprotein-sorting protein